jgi:hypothetical protein
MKEIAALALFISTPAFAGWQWTQWGMTPDQVKAAAAPGTVGPYNDPKLDTPAAATRLVTNYYTKLYAFSVAMSFDRRSQGLSQVRLLLNEGGDRNHLMCAELYGEMQRVYGDPDRAASPRLSVWRDAAHDNLITLDANQGCWLVYEPIPTTNSSGL